MSSSPSFDEQMSQNQRPRIAFYGLGNMGASMALNLLKAGHDVSVYDLVPENIKKLAQQGAMAASSPSSAAENANIIISMLPAGKHVKSLYEDISVHCQPNSLFIDCSTIAAQEACELGSSLKKQGHRFVDAPVSGGVAGAAAGTLTFIMGGNTQDVESAKIVLNDMGANCYHAGETGAGQITKICNNMLLAVLMTATSEALKMATDNGLDAKVVSDIMQKSSGNNWTLEKYNPVPHVMENVPSSNNYDGGFLVDLMNKDLHLAMQTAASSNSVTPMGSLAKSMYQLHSLNGFGRKDFSSIFQAFNQS